MYKILFITLSIIILMIFLFIKKNKIPRKIWTFWDSEDLPDFISNCIRSWYIKNENYEIVILNNNNLDNYLDKDEIIKIKSWKWNDSHQKLSDLIRLHILYKYGGIWLDASIVCYENFDWVHNENSDCILYTIPELSLKVPLIESWFIACTPKNKFIKNWKEEFLNVDRFETIDDYVNYINIDMTGINFNNYLLVYVCARKVYLEEEKTKIKLLNASEGPYKYHKLGGLETICSTGFKPKFYKFRKEDRANMTYEIMDCLF